MGKIIKAHPAYAGSIMTATFQIARELGWEYFEKLARQKVMQVQSSTDPPKKLALGERAVMADGNDYNLIQLKEQGAPVEVVYAGRGHAADHGADAACSRMRPIPMPLACSIAGCTASRRSSCWSTTPASTRCTRRPRRRRAGRKLSEIKLMKDDPAGVEKAAEEIKARYAQIFKV